MWTREKIIEFERADQRADQEWFAINWTLYHKEMANHVIMTYQIFGWTAFELWLKNSKDVFAQKLHGVLTEEACDFI